MATSGSSMAMAKSTAGHRWNTVGPSVEVPSTTDDHRWDPMESQYRSVMLPKVSLNEESYVVAVFWMVSLHVLCSSASLFIYSFFHFMLLVVYLKLVFWRIKGATSVGLVKLFLQKWIIFWTFFGLSAAGLHRSLEQLGDGSFNLLEMAWWWCMCFDCFI